jgi:aminoacrylate hydrolase
VPRLALADGAELYFEVKGSGAALLLIPGLGGTGSFWSEQLHQLARRYRVIIHDHRGTGQSSRSRIRYSIGQMARDVIELMDGLGLARAHILGHSTGGAIGQVLALDHAARVDRLVLSATWCGPDPYFKLLFELRADILRRLGPLAYLRCSELFLMPEDWIRDHSRTLGLDAAAAAQEIPDPEILLSRIQALLDFDRRADIPAIRAPTLVIVARDDKVVPAYCSQEIAAKIPGARLVQLDSGGHFAPRLAPEPYNAAVEGFLAG